MCGGNLNQCAQCHRKGETWHRIKEETSHSNRELSRGFVIVKEHIIHILLREHCLEDNCHQYESVGELICRRLGVHQGRNKEGHSNHSIGENEEDQEQHSNESLI